MSAPKPVVLVVLDGWGVAPPGPGNAITQARTPFYDSLMHQFPYTQLGASGDAVGVPHNEAGNSEVGHLNLGAGYVVQQDLLRINHAIADGSFFQNRAFLAACRHVKSHYSRLHLMGLISPAAVHSSLEHLIALIRLAKNQRLSSVFVHAFTDGRDSSPTSAQGHLSDLVDVMSKVGVGRLASLVGRYYAMDRDERWRRTQQAYDLLTRGKGQRVGDYVSAVNDSYQRGTTDEFIKPVVLLDEEGQPLPRIRDNDAVIFFNFRTDRPRQLTRAFVLPEFEEFPRQRCPRNLFFVTLTRYEESLPVSAVAFEPQNVTLPLGAVLAHRGFRQLHLAESEKFPHVTYFFNGGREDPFEGEERIDVPSPKVATYDLQPEMSAPAVTQILVERIKEDLYDFILVNFANPDMVAHTGNFAAALRAAETIDESLKQVVPVTQAKHGVALITSDHGNLEAMRRADGTVDTEHNTSPVPFICVSQQPHPRRLPPGILADVAPTILGLLNLPRPGTMTGKDLLA